MTSWWGWVPFFGGDRVKSKATMPGTYAWPWVRHLQCATPRGIPEPGACPGQGACTMPWVWMLSHMKCKLWALPRYALQCTIIYMYPPAFVQLVLNTFSCEFKFKSFKCLFLNTVFLHSSDLGVSWLKKKTRSQRTVSTYYNLGYITSTSTLYSVEDNDQSRQGSN